MRKLFKILKSKPHDDDLDELEQRVKLAREEATKVAKQVGKIQEYSDKMLARIAEKRLAEEWQNLKKEN